MESGQALWAALENGRLEMARFLLARGADPCAKASSGRSLLAQACLGGDLEGAALLLRAVACPVEEDSEGETPLDCALVHEKMEMSGEFSKIKAAGLCAVLCDACDSKAQKEALGRVLAPMAFKAAGGAPGCLGELALRGADMGFKGERKENLLMEAAQSGNAECLRALARASRWDLERRDCDGATALMRAARAGSGECVKLLLEMGAQPEARCALGRTALMYAARETGSALEALVGAGALPGGLDGQGWSALMHACDAQPENVGALLEAGARVSDGGSKPALELLAARAPGKSKLAAARRLLEAGADPNCASPKSAPPVFYAIESLDAEFLNLLLVSGADPGAKRGGEEAVFAALGKGRADMALALLEAGADPDREIWKWRRRSATGRRRCSCRPGGTGGSLKRGAFRGPRQKGVRCEEQNGARQRSRSGGSKAGGPLVQRRRLGRSEQPEAVEGFYGLFKRQKEGLGIILGGGRAGALRAWHGGEL